MSDKSDLIKQIMEDASMEKPDFAMMWSEDAATLAGITDPTHPWLAEPSWITMALNDEATSSPLRP
jgi:hypothetical protein